MGELNPQVTNQLRVLATSPQFVPHVTCFSPQFDPSRKKKIVEAITEVNTTPAGKQLMTIFQCERIEERPFSVLQSTRELMAAYDRLDHEADTPESASISPPPVSTGGRTK
jgi:ABC-type phosphate/phosphonate transport system substrate-binding protein